MHAQGATPARAGGPPFYQRAAAPPPPPAAHLARVRGGREGGEGSIVFFQNGRGARVHEDASVLGAVGGDGPVVVAAVQAALARLAQIHLGAGRCIL